MIVNKVKEVAGATVVIRWEPSLDEVCPVVWYSVYYRQVKNLKEQWNLAVTVDRNATSHTLYLNCRKEYEIAVTAMNASGEGGVHDSGTWIFKTGGGKYQPYSQPFLGW